jgi:aspartate carbamoyltransferase regulatory subunit
MKTLSVAAIKNGTVIDHITPGSALKIILLLKLQETSCKVTLGLHFDSASGVKDFIKIEDRFLTEKEAHDIAVFAPHATINIIKNYKVVEKVRAKLPSAVHNILVCPNARCITHKEPVSTLFHVEESGQKVSLRCHFCERLFQRDALKDYL